MSPSKAAVEAAEEIYSKVYAEIRRLAPTVRVSAQFTTSLASIIDRHALSAELISVAKEVLERDSLGAASGMPNDCRCLTWSRATEREYETGTCPHQRMRALLATLSNED